MSRPMYGIGAGAKEGRSRIGVIQAIPQVLEELGCDPAEALAEVGLDAGLFADPNNLIRDTLIGRVLRHCATRTGCEDFAFRVGQRAGLASLGLVGELAAASPDVGTGLRVLSRFLGLNDGGGIVSISVEGGLASFDYAIYEDGLEDAGQIYQMSGAVVLNILRTLCGPNWAPREAMLPCRRPRDQGPFRQSFRAPTRFDSSRMALIFPRDWLCRPLPSADASRYAELSAQAAEFEAQAPLPLDSQVRRVVRNLMLEGKASIEAVARTFSVHRRTLDRHLDANGFSFRALADAVRFEVACQLLRDTQMTVSAVAASLHYADSSAFNHAFRRWSGEAPTNWREAARCVRAAGDSQGQQQAMRSEKPLEARRIGDSAVAGAAR